MTTLFKIGLGVVGVAALATTILYIKRPKAKVIVYADGSADAYLGSKMVSTKGNVENGSGTLEAQTWNGWSLDIDYPITGSRGGYALRHNGKIIEETLILTPYQGGSSYVELINNLPKTS